MTSFASQMSIASLRVWVRLAPFMMGLLLGCSRASWSRLNPWRTKHVPPVARFDDMLLRGGTVVNASGQVRADVRVKAGLISEVGQLQALPDERVVDVTGKLLMPGGIDPHVHLTEAPETPPEWRRPDDLEIGSRAAFAGGLTTLGNMSWFGDSMPWLSVMDDHEAQVAEFASADIMLHPVVPPATLETLADLRRLFARGHISPKIFMADPLFDVNYYGYVKAIELARNAGALTLLHCEDSALLAAAVDGLYDRNETDITHYAESRPVIAEVAAIERAISIAEYLRAPIYIVHLSSDRALEAAKRAKQRGVMVYVEVRPLYLHLSQEHYQDGDAGLFTAQPPLRAKEDVEALWRGLLDGTVDTLGSDHAPWSKATKLTPSSLDAVPAGVANIDHMLPLLFSEGVLKRKLSLERFVSLSSFNAAKLFGLYPHKGVIAPQADADIVVWDPTVTKPIRGDETLSRAGYSVYEGMSVTGWPVMTLRRGELVFDHGKFSAAPGSGKLLRRTGWQKPGAAE